MPDYPLVELGGNGLPIHLALANGFPPEVYRPLLEPFTARFRVLCLLPRPLWNPPPDPDGLTSWRQFAADLLEGLRAHNLTDVIAVGHSMGGVHSLLAALAEPQRFRALILLDPTILPPLTLAAIRLLRAVGMGQRFPLVQGALRRRAHFASAEEAFAYWRGKPLFRNWSDEVLRLYAEGLTHPAPDGGVTLRWSPQWEARAYQTIFTEVWREVPRLRGVLPILVLRGAQTNTFVAASERRMRRLLPEATYVTLQGHGHLFPMSAPQEAQQVIAAWLKEQGIG